MDRRRNRLPPRFGTRLALLLLCAAGGALVGFLGSTLSGSSAWYLALPLAVAGGWLFVGTPDACAPPPADGNEPRGRR